MPTEQFYADLPVLADFAGMTEVSKFRPLPPDWFVAVADIVGSTRAIAQGAYKQVNIVGAACVTAVLNGVKPLEVPYVFGGDGATLCVPQCVRAQASEALLGTKSMAADAFGFDVRVAMVSMKDIAAAGHGVLVARYRVSPHYTS